MDWRGWWSPMLAVDLGTAVTQIGSPRGGLLLEEPSVIALQRGARKVLGRGAAVGKLARQMLGRTPDSMTAVRPVQQGVVTDFELCEAMLRYFLAKARPHAGGFRPSLLVTTPGRMTPVERRAVLNSAERAGAARVWLLPQLEAAAAGAGLPIAEPMAHLICHMGAGVTEVAVFSLAEVVAWRSLRTAGDELDRCLVDYVRTHYSLRIGLQTAEQLKLKLASAWPLREETSSEICGLDAVGGVPRRALITSEEVREALQPALQAIVAGIRSVIEGCQPELVADLANTGIVLTGGTAALPGLADYFKDRLGIPTRVAADPQRTAIRGAMTYLDRGRGLVSRESLIEEVAA